LKRSTEDLERMTAMRAEGKTLVEIGKLAGISKQRVSVILGRRN